MHKKPSWTRLQVTFSPAIPSREELSSLWFTNRLVLLNNMINNTDLSYFTIGCTGISRFELLKRCLVSLFFYNPVPHVLYILFTYK